jgi:polar amino acid transport system substrate-binding protein
MGNEWCWFIVWMLVGSKLASHPDVRAVTLEHRCGPLLGEESMKLFRGAALAVVVALAGLSAVRAEAQEIKIGTEGAYPPWNNLNAKGELEGFEIDFGNALCEKMKVKCTWVAQDWDGIIPALLSKKYDLIMAGMNATEERKQKIDFSSVYTLGKIIVIGPKADANTDISPAALKGKSIGVQGSTIHANYAEKYFAESTIKPYPSQEEANLDLANGRLDYVMADEDSLVAFLGKAEGGCCKVTAEVTRDATIHGAGVGAAFRKEDAELRAKFNAALKEAFADGTFKKINDKHFPTKNTCEGCTGE